MIFISTVIIQFKEKLQKDAYLIKNFGRKVSYAIYDKKDQYHIVCVIDCNPAANPQPKAYALFFEFHDDVFRKPDTTTEGAPATGSCFQWSLRIKER
jgi:hypothetical protein